MYKFCHRVYFGERCCAFILLLQKFMKIVSMHVDIVNPQSLLVQETASFVAVSMSNCY